MSAYPSGTYPRKAFNAPKFESDPLNSTYRWEIDLTIGHPDNSSRVQQMVGYSKGAGAENPNRVLLLYRKITNPLVRYLYKADRITIFEQIPGVPPAYHIKLMTLYRQEFETFSWVKEDVFFNQFLINLYAEYLKHGKLPPEEDRRKNVRKDVYFAELDHSKLTFATHQDLVDFCKARIEKFSRECMKGFYQAHRDFQPELFENDIHRAALHAKHEAPTSDAAQAIYSGINNMHAKFTERP